MMARSISASPNEATSPLRPCAAQAVCCASSTAAVRPNTVSLPASMRCRRAMLQRAPQLVEIVLVGELRRLVEPFWDHQLGGYPLAFPSVGAAHASAHEHLGRLGQRDDAEAERDAQLHRPLVERGLEKSEGAALPGSLRQPLAQAAQIADRARRAGRAVGLVDERLDCRHAGVAAFVQRREDRREGERAFARSAPVRIVEMDVADQAGRQPSGAAGRGSAPLRSGPPSCNRPWCAPPGCRSRARWPPLPRPCSRTPSARATAARCNRSRSPPPAAAATAAKQSAARLRPSASSPGASSRCCGEPWTRTRAPSSWASSHRRRITSTVRARCAASAEVIDRPAGARRR